ncbi:MAG: Eco57I restriction-modification methylase domain-containing protein [Prevotella sp.]|nr:Eco57I restriction-modification methylase domain-containing protein [Prevotella sp.]
MARFTSSLKPKLIYVFRINDEAHRGCWKIGETTYDGNANYLLLRPCSTELNNAARKRINEYTQTAGIVYDLCYTESTIYNKGKEILSFNDKEVHYVLLRSGIKRKVFDKSNNANEWFITDLETIKKAIAAVKEGRMSLSAGEVNIGRDPIIFRPEQKAAIDKTEKHFRHSNKMLWNAKMRFGKTLSALQVVKDMNFRRTLILTHRPVVDAGWFEDFGKIFFDRHDFKYGSKKHDASCDKAYGNSLFSELEAEAAMGETNYVYFASMQDLRGSEKVGGKFDKNDDVFSTDWNFIIVDEAHEGTQTELGIAVMEALEKPSTKVLRLSGTPFNLLDDFKEEEIYTWDYVMEQRAKHDWDKTHFGDPNPYASLPTLNIYTYDLGRLLSEFKDEDVAFNFREFFRTDDNGSFVHAADVWAFLNLLTKEDDDSLYPYANKTYRSIFRHTLWMLPGVKEAKALSAMLQSHPVFQYFKVVNVAGEGDDGEERSDALYLVKNAIGDNPEQSYTITLSCGRLTTGVSVKAWTGVFMLSGSYSTAASSYMQTIFRVQTPATINGRMKEECYVFDFAPDRTLKVLAETAKVSARAGKTTDGDRKIMGEFLNFCPVISIEGSKMLQYDVPHLLEQLKKVYVERVVQNGFEDNSLYNDELLKLGDMDLKDFEGLKDIIGKTKAMPKTNNIDINTQGLTNEEYEEKERLEKKKRQHKNELTEEEKKRLEELNKAKKTRQSAIEILRGISIRMPLMIYGADIKDEEKELTIDNFTRLVDSQSWEEFMPKGVDKATFNKFKRYYDRDIFAAAGKRIRAIARAADNLTVEERIQRITGLFSTFRNPDKETVLTPWRVVNMQLGDCLGGYCFFDDKYEHALEEPRFIDRGKVTQQCFDTDARILEINSKSGLYPLYMAYGIYRSKLASSLFSVSGIDNQRAVWDDVVRHNLFVICKTPMAKSITKRTLVGFRDAKVNTRHFEDLVNQIKNKSDKFVQRISNGRSYWNANDEENMKFTAIVGNPPYQVMDGGAGASATPVYNHFVDIAKKIKPNYISMIMPARWYSGGKGLDEFRKDMLSDLHISVLHDFLNGRTCFANVEIKGGICYLLWDRAYNGKCNIYAHNIDNTLVDISTRYMRDNDEDIFIRDVRLANLKAKVCSNSFKSLKDMVSSMKPYGLRGDFFKNQAKYKLPDVYEISQIDGITIYGLDEKQHRVKRYIAKNYPLPKNDGLYCYKIFVPRNFGSGRLEDNTFKAIVAKPLDICTETFVQIYPFNSFDEAKHCNKYISSKFVRMLIGIRKQDQGAGREVYRFVPLQDFTKESDIDWSKSIAEIDAQLYKKYKLSEEDISFIENTIKPM